MTSKPYAYEGRLFRYNFDNATVECISKADEEMLKENEEWQAKYGKDLWDIDADGYTVIASIGLRRENWKKKAIRDEYLSEWCFELGEEAAILADNFVKYEMPHLIGVAGNEEL